MRFYYNSLFVRRLLCILYTYIIIIIIVDNSLSNFISIKSELFYKNNFSGYFLDIDNKLVMFIVLIICIQYSVTRVYYHEFKNKRYPHLKYQ